jgi:hypothetical protein
MLVFELEKYEHISGIIFCDKYILSEDYEIIESMFLIHNPLAKNPIDIDTFSDINQWI